MKKNRFILIISSLFLLFSLSSCDFSLFLQDSTRNKDNTTEEENKTEKKDLNEEKEEDNNEDSEYDMNLYLSDYHNKYGYLALALDEEHGELMQQAYSDFYEASKALLLSNENQELQTTVVSEQAVTFLQVYESPYYESLDTINYYKSAWSVFISENPIFYFLSNGFLSRSKTSTTTETKSNGEIVNKTEVTTYSFILVGYDNFATFESRDQINRKIAGLFNDTKAINDLETRPEKIQGINNYLKEKLEYAYKADGTPEDSYWAHSILGLLLNNKGVCECYSKSFKLLMDYYSLETISVYGKTFKTGEAHAWNYVKLDDAWYGMDVTWNDSTKSDLYYLCNKSKMDEDHIPYGTTYGITYQPTPPTLSDTKYE